MIWTALFEILAIVAKETIKRSTNEVLTTAAEGAALVAGVTGSVLAVSTRKITPEEGIAQIDKLMVDMRTAEAKFWAERAGDRAAIDEAVRLKFPGSKP